MLLLAGMLGMATNNGPELSSPDWCCSVSIVFEDDNESLLSPLDVTVDVDKLLLSRLSDICLHRFLVISCSYCYDVKYLIPRWDISSTEQIS